MRLLFAGTPVVALPALAALLSSRHDVVAVLTRPDAPSGRGRRLQPSPVKARALEAGIEVLEASSVKDPAVQERIRGIGPDCAPVVAYGALLPPAVLDVPLHGWVNLHFSLLPAWRGAAPVQHAVLAGDEVTGATTFRLERGMDTGPVFGVTTEDVRPGDTSGDLLERLAVAGAGLLACTLDAIEDGTVTAVPQPADGVSLAPKITVEDARVDWTAPALRVDRLVRACTPAPGAWTTLRGKRVKLAPVVITDEVLGAGELCRLESGECLVGTATTAVRLSGVRPEGKAAMAASDWLRGLRLEPGEAFA